MGWEDDHINAVIGRWAKKYHESNMTAADFSEYMKQTMIHYGWPVSIASKMAAAAVKK